MAASDAAELTPAQVSGSHGILVLAKKVTAATVAGPAAASLVAVSRFGVGYDSVDVEACTANDVAVLIAAGAVDHSMAEATVGFMLQLTHRSLAKHRLVADGGWDARSGLMGAELRDRVFGAVGLGGIAQATIQMLAGFRMAPPIAYDPYADPKVARALGVRLVSLDELLAEADVVSVHCPLNPTTRGLLGAAELAKMKRGSYLINTARGGIVSEDALLAELNAGRIAGAATDCFEAEPVVGKHPLFAHPNFVAAPHCIGWTAELFRDIGAAACGSLVEMAAGRRPTRGVVNPEVFDKESFQRKWAKVRAGKV